MIESSNLIYTPQNRIPLGEAVILHNGTHGLRIKWKRGKQTVTETVTLDKLHELVVQGNTNNSSQRSP